MTRAFTEILLIIPMALTTGFLMFIAGVIQGAMNDLDEATFKRYLTAMHHHALRSPYAIVVSSITWVGAIPYFIFYGFRNGWLILGLILWTVASIVSKLFNLPIYDRIFATESGDKVRLNEERRKLQRANVLRAALSFASVVLAAIGFAKGLYPARGATQS